MSFLFNSLHRAAAAYNQFSSSSENYSLVKGAKNSTEMAHPRIIKKEKEKEMYQFSLFFQSFLW